MIPTFVIVVITAQHSDWQTSWFWKIDRCLVYKVCNEVNTEYETLSAASKHKKGCKHSEITGTLEFM